MISYLLGLCEDPQFISGHRVVKLVGLKEGLEHAVLGWGVFHTAAHGDWLSYKKRRKQNLALVSNDDLKFQ